MANCTEVELGLAQELKKLCYLNGREKEPRESAKTLHKLGLEYMKRSPDKVCLIQSATLINAAIVRKPDNILEVRKDLDRLGELVLRLAGVRKTNTNLFEIAITLHKAITQKRDDVTEELAELKHIPERRVLDSKWLRKLEQKKIKDIQKIQYGITKNFSAYMEYLSDYCLKILGNPPNQCKFALVGMGSLARKEITPYSDFENVIVLEEGSQLWENYAEVLEYFRWFAVIFQIILINMGETIVPSVAVPCLNDFSKPNGDWFFDAHTTCGVSFDGLMPHACKSPLGRQNFTEEKGWATELIKPVSEMVYYLDTEQDLKNGYHLADVLSKTCFVAGHRSVYRSFQESVSDKLARQRKQNTKFVDELLKQISDDQLKFDIDENCSSMYANRKFNMKSVIYRSTTIFISALGTYHGIEENSCFEILDKLCEKQIITDDEKHRLSYAVAIACEVRLKIYMKRKGQKDWIDDHNTSYRERAEIVQAVGGKSIADYFTIAKAFQQSLTHLTTNRFNKPLQLNLQLDFRYTVDICCKLRLYGTCMQICSSLLKSRKVSLSPRDEAACHYYIGISLLDLENPRAALKRFERELEFRNKHMADDSKSDALIADCYYNIGRCLQRMAKYEKALENFETELSIRRKLTEDERFDSDMAFCLQEVGNCLLGLHNGEEALKNFQEALEIRKKLAKDEDTDTQVVHCVSQIGLCLTKIKDYEAAMLHFDRALFMRRKVSSDETTDLQVADSLDQVGLCQINMERYRDALPNFEKSLAIRKSVETNKTRNVYIAKCIYNISICKSFIEEHETPLT